MKTDWHDTIQRYIANCTTTEETMALEEALKADAELRALYLDYINLDVALSAAAEAVTITKSKAGRASEVSRPSARLSSHPWRWVAAAAACAALIVFAMLPGHRDPSPSRPDFAATISSTQGAIARLSVEPPSLFPEWASVTDSMLDQLRIPQ